MASRKYDFYDKSYQLYPDLSLAKAKEIGDKIGVDFSLYDLGEFRQGIKEEMEHGSLYEGITNGGTHVHNDSYETAGRIALAHLVEMPDYYQRLEDMETTAEKEWGEDDEKIKKAREWIASNYKDEEEILKKEGVSLP